MTLQAGRTRQGRGGYEIRLSLVGSTAFDTPSGLINNRSRMIGHLRGQLAEKRPNQVMVDVGGVGYQVAVPLSTFYALGELRENVTLLIHTHLREDSIALYGFLDRAREAIFRAVAFRLGRRAGAGAEDSLGHERGGIGSGDSRGRFACA